MNAEKVQVGGNHYKKMEYQTARFGFDVGLESLGTQIAKYLTRDKGSRTENLEKAYHCIALDQQFDKDYMDEGHKRPSLALYLEGHDEPLLEKYFSQFEDGEKLKAVMRQYMKANFPQAKGLLRKYINSLPKVLKVGSSIRKKDGSNFSCYRTTAIIRKIGDDKIWIESGGWLYKREVELV